MAGMGATVSSVWWLKSAELCAKHRRCTGKSSVYLHVPASGQQLWCELQCSVVLPPNCNYDHLLRRGTVCHQYLTSAYEVAVTCKVRRYLSTKINAFADGYEAFENDDKGKVCKSSVFV